MSVTYTTSQTSTFSEARARAVMRDVLGDFMNAASANLIAREAIQQWHQELEFAVLHNVVDVFQLQFTRPDGVRSALSYTVKDDGSLLEEAKAGGIDFLAFPRGTRVSVTFRYREGAANIEKVQAYLRERGWTSTGTILSGATSRDRTFSKGGFGVERSKIGDWE